MTHFLPGCAACFGMCFQISSELCSFCYLKVNVFLQSSLRNDVNSLHAVAFICVLSFGVVSLRKWLGGN